MADSPIHAIGTEGLDKDAESVTSGVQTEPEEAADYDTLNLRNVILRSATSPSRMGEIDEEIKQWINSTKKSHNIKLSSRKLKPVKNLKMLY